MKLMDYKPVPVVRRDIASSLFKFSIGNYTASNLAMLPSYLMPIMIVAILNPEASAFFYIGFSVSGILGMVAGSMAFSLIAESSYEPDLLRHNVIKSARTSLLITGIGIAVVFAVGRIILGWFNPAYVENATHILWVSSLIWLPAIPNTLYLAVARVKINIKAIIGVDGALAGLIVGLAFVLLPRFGAVGASYAFLVGHGLLSCFTAPTLLKSLGINVKNLIRGDGLVSEHS
jgi:O-antigen/teichoic acid export membrane protein